MALEKLSLQRKQKNGQQMPKEKIINTQYSFNGEWLTLEQLPADLQEAIALEADFWKQIEEANGDMQKIAEIHETHPYNN